jgi:hypothetical protein
VAEKDISMQLKNFIRNEKYHKFLLAVNLFLLYVTLFSISACEYIAPIKVQNNTEETLSIFIDGVRIGDVAPGEEIKNKTIWIEARWIIEAKNTHGQIIHKEEITYENMKKKDWKVIISPKMENMSSDNTTGEQTS